MANMVIPNDVYVTGSLRANSLIVPNNTIGDAQVNSNSPITAAKLQHRHQKIYSQVNGSAATTVRIPIHVGYGTTGTILQFQAGVVTACVGAATVVVDLKKNGTTVLSATISITSATAAFASVAATISSAAYAQNDVFEVVVTATAGGGTLGQGLFVMLTLNEDAQ